MNIFSSIQEEEHTVDGLFGVTEFNLVALIGAAAVVVVVVDDDGYKQAENHFH